METPRAGRLAIVCVALVVFAAVLVVLFAAVFAMCALGESRSPWRFYVPAPHVHAIGAQEKVPGRELQRTTHAAENYSRRAAMTAQGLHGRTWHVSPWRLRGFA